jgi:hypothetical protein
MAVVRVVVDQWISESVDQWISGWVAVDRVAVVRAASEQGMSRTLNTAIIY